MNQNKRFSVVLNEFDEIEYITDIVDCEDRGFAEFLDYVDELMGEYDRLEEENEKLKATNQDYEDYLGDLEADFVRLEKEYKELKEENDVFFKQVFGILLKYQDLFNREMADEVSDELGIELTRWFE